MPAYPMSSQDEERTAGRLRWLEQQGVVVVGDDPANGFLYRNGDLLVSGPADSEADRQLSLLKPMVDDADAPVRRYRLPDMEFPRTREILADLPTTESVQVSLNHVLTGEPAYSGGPDGPPRPAPNALPALAAVTPHPLLVGIVDTGVDVTNPWLGGHLALPCDPDPADVSAPIGYLDTEAGHGTFVAGCVLRREPRVTVRVRSGLNSDGWGTDLSISQAINRLQNCSILNLSLGGFTQGDRPPPHLTRALRAWKARNPGGLVVAAAGNAGMNRRFFPAALAVDEQWVVSVAALDGNGAGAGFSNRGDWVRASARGTDCVSSYLKYSGQPADFDRWAVWGGTSFATPHVAGAIASEMLSGPSLSAQQAWTRLQQAAAYAPSQDFGVAVT